MHPEKNPGGHRGDIQTGQVIDQDKSESAPLARQPLRERLMAHTAPFLAGLLGVNEDEAWTRPVTLQIFDDTPNKDRSRAEIIHGCLDDLAERLDRLNTHGDGIYITPNATDLKGRQKKNIIALRAAWADLDEKAACLPFDMAKVPLSPSIAVKSGHGMHLYWRFPEPIPCDGARQVGHEALLRGIQSTLKDFGADGQVCQVASVLRLPGFYNMKREPVLVEVIRA